MHEAMKITVKFFGVLRNLAGVTSIQIYTEESLSIAKLLKIVCKKTEVALADKLLENGEIKKGTLLLIDGKNVVHLHGLDTLIPSDSTVSFFPPSGGG